MLGTFFSGFSAATFFACGLFFLKFWLASRDRLFLVFCGAFALFGIERMVGMAIFMAYNYNDAQVNEVRNWLYMIRLLAFILILSGIIQKNRAGSR